MLDVWRWDQGVLKITACQTETLLGERDKKILKGHGMEMKVIGNLATFSSNSGSGCKIA